MVGEQKWDGIECKGLVCIHGMDIHPIFDYQHMQ